MSKDYQTSYNLFSTFREETSHGVGDPFNDKPATESSRHRGKRMTIQPLLKGKTQEVYMDKVTRSLADGDQYLDAADLAKEFQTMIGGKPVTEKAFFPPKNSRKPACPGDTSQCMGPMGLLGQDWQDRQMPVSKIKGKKNLYTNPSREGGPGYSYVDRTVGGNPPPYMPDEYARGHILGRELRKKARDRIPKPFNSAPNSGNGLFNKNPWSETPGPTYIVKKEKKREIAKPFRPSHPPRKGAAYEALSNTGRDYVPDPIRHPQYTSRSDAKPASFKPCAGIKDRLSMRSINPYQYDARPPPSLDFTLLG